MLATFLNPPLTDYRKVIRNFDCATESKANYLYQPYDFLVMSASVPEDWSLELIDGIAEKSTVEMVLSKLRKLNPDILVISMANTSWDDDFCTLKSVRKILEDTKIFVFGDLFIEEHYRERVYQFVDGILEDPIHINFRDLAQGKVPLARGMFKEDKSLLKSPQKVAVGIPRHELFEHRSYRWPFARYKKYTSVFTAWGCPYSCSYCVMSSFPNLWREADEVINEMKYIKSLGYKEIYIADRSFGVFYENTINILEQMIMLEFDFSWSSYFHPNQYNKKMLDLMKRSGCHTLIIGIESADVKTLKKYGRHVKREKLEELLSHCKRIGIEVCADFIIGLPNETASDIRKTIELAQKLNIEYASFNIATPLPGTELRKNAILDKKEKVSGFSRYDSLGNSNVLDNGILSGLEIRSLRDEAVFKFYLRPRYLFKRILSIKSFEHFLIQLNEGLSLLFSYKKL